MQRSRHLFVWLVPLVWGTTCVVSFQYPGDEYGLWGIASIPGLWLPVLLGVGSLTWILCWTVAAGVPLFAAIGALLDRLKAAWWGWYGTWLVSATALCAWELLSYPSWARAMSKNGSFEAYALSSSNLGLALATVVMLVVSGCLWVGNRLLSCFTAKTGREAEAQTRASAGRLETASSNESGTVPKERSRLSRAARSGRLQQRASHRRRLRSIEQ